MKKISAWGWIASILVIIGAINWGLVGLFNFNLVNTIFGYVVSRVIYVLVGLSGVWFLFFLCKCGKACKGQQTSNM